MKDAAYKRIVIIFIITALWDVVLRFMAQGHIKFLGIENMKWVVVLKEYFEKHTLLAAALIAGFVGAVTQLVIETTFPTMSNEYITGLAILLLSGLIGIPMRYSGLFPELKKYYYDRLGFTYSFLADANSGLVVLLTYVALTRIQII